VSVQAPLAAVIDRCLAKEPGARYQGPMRYGRPSTPWPRDRDGADTATAGARPVAGAGRRRGVVLIGIAAALLLAFDSAASGRA